MGSGQGGNGEWGGAQLEAPTPLQEIRSHQACYLSNATLRMCSVNELGYLMSEFADEWDNFCSMQSASSGALDRFSVRKWVSTYDEPHSTSCPDSPAVHVPLLA